MELRKFKHAEILMKWLTDPSLELQYEFPPGTWQTTEYPTWGKDVEYRFKLKTIRIGEFDVPEPVRQVLKTGTQYCVPMIAHTLFASVQYTWSDDPFDHHALNSGMIHLSKEDAEIHARALISLTKDK